MSATKLHSDDTPVPVLAPGRGKTKTGRLWTYVRDDRPWGDQTPPAVWYAYTPDRRVNIPKRTCKTSRVRCRRMPTAGMVEFMKVDE